MCDNTNTPFHVIEWLCFYFAFLPLYFHAKQILLCSFVFLLSFGVHITIFTSRTTLIATRVHVCLFEFVNTFYPHSPSLFGCLSIRVSHSTHSTYVFLGELNRVPRAYRLGACIWIKMNGCSHIEYDEHWTHTNTHSCASKCNLCALTQQNVFEKPRPLFTSNAIWFVIPILFFLPFVLHK